MNWSDTGSGNGGIPESAIAVNVPSGDALLSDLRSRLSAGQGFCVATLNLDHVVKIRSMAAFRDAYQRHSHITADGNPIVWLSRLAGQKVALVPGSELVDPVAALAAELAVPVAFLGTTQTSLAQTAQVLSQRYPGLNVVAQIAPAMGFDATGPQADAAIETLDAAGARLVFLALGAPKQELFAIHAQKRMPHTGFLSIGAGLDFISGTQVRAPRWVRLLAAEWLWRLAANPTRLARRYGACLAILPGLTRTALRSRSAPTTPAKT